MRKYWSEGGRSNPDFRYKVKVSFPLTGMVEWCEDYPTRTKDGDFERYYIQFATGDSGYATFQFEQEEPAIMFTLMFVK
jgi:hypothetical protein